MEIARETTKLSLNRSYQEVAMRRIAVCLLLLVPLSSRCGDAKLLLVLEDDSEKGSHRWPYADPKAWRIVKTDKGHVSNQFAMSKYTPKVRSPHNISPIKVLIVSAFILEAEVQSTAKDAPHPDMCLYFGVQDPTPFYHVHTAKTAA